MYVIEPDVISLTIYNLQDKTKRISKLKQLCTLTICLQVDIYFIRGPHTSCAFKHCILPEIQQFHCTILDTMKRKNATCLGIRISVKDVRVLCILCRRST